jgi:NAD+ synthase
MITETLSTDLLCIDPAAVSAEIENAVRDIVFKRLRRKGVVVGLSGGIDSSTAAALAVRALGKDRVLGVLMPERESAGNTTDLGRLVADSLGIQTYLEDISPALRSLACYSRRDDAIRTVVPEYGAGWKSKIVLSDIVGGASYSIFSVVVESPDGVQTRVRLTPDAYLTIVAATNFKQRVRKMLEYFYADRYNYAVIGTPNRLEYDQGFFVKNGDGSADLKPIAHLYKSQVYALAEYIGVPAEICSRPPTTDTYSLEQSQEEFFFALPYAQMDLCLYAKDHNFDPAEIAPMAGLTAEQVERVYRMIDSKRKAAVYLHMPPVLVGEITDQYEDMRDLVSTS